MNPADGYALAIAVARGLDRPFVGDDLVDAGALERVPDLYPYDGTVLADVAMADEAVVDAAVRAARGALAGPWGALAASDRADLMRALADRVVAQGEQLALLEALDVGKPIGHARAEDVPLTAAVFRWYASLAETYYDQASSRRTGALGQIVREPQGVVGVVLPWNYPLFTLALKLAPALAAGNTVVAKPAEDTPLTTLRLAQIAIEAGFPAGVLNVVPGRGAVAGRAIGLHAGVDAINFTGSTTTGRQFLRYAADSNLKEVTLECGGKNPAVVLPDVTRLDKFVEQIGIGFMHNSGQICSSISRLLLPGHLRGQARQVLADEMARWPAGDPIDEATRIGPLISARQADKVCAAIAAGRSQTDNFLQSDAVSSGASPLIVPPAIFFDVDERSPLWREEIFGPVLSVRFYDGLDEAVRSANDTDYGLSGYIFSEDPTAITAVAPRLDAGFVSINAFGEGDFSTPFGGFKQSGFGGKDKGVHALDQYSRTKSVWWDTSPRPTVAPTAGP